MCLFKTSINDNLEYMKEEIISKLIHIADNYRAGHFMLVETEERFLT